MIYAKRLAIARDDIATERRRQIEVEGWTPSHDDEHSDGSLLRAAVLYYHHAMGGERLRYEDGVPVGWPWERRWWKPKDRQRNLIRAGALCHAERDRLKRAGSSHVEHVNSKLRLIEKAL